MEAKEIIPEIAEISYNNEGILIMRMHNKSNIDKEAAQKIINVANKLAGDKVHVNLVDIRQMTFMSSDARKQFGSQNKSTVKAVAIVMNSVLHRPLANLYLKFSRPSIPTRMFDNEEKAIEWLREIVQTNL